MNSTFIIASEVMREIDAHGGFLSDSEINSYLKNRSLGCPITNLNEMEKIKHNIYWHHRFTYYTEKIGNQLYFANKYKVPKYQLEGKALRRKPLRFQ